MKNALESALVLSKIMRLLKTVHLQTASHDWKQLFILHNLSYPIASLYRPLCIQGV